MRKIILFIFAIVAINATTPTYESVTKLYIATFDRAPDAAGLEYWLKSGMSIEEIATSFFDQPETKAKYPDELDNIDFIVEVYANLFNRAPESEGLDYWLKELESGRITRATLILAVTNGAKGDDAKILAHKTIVGLAYAKDGRNDVDEAYKVMDGITADYKSVPYTLCEFGLSGCPVKPIPTPPVPGPTPPVPGPTPPANNTPVADAGEDQTTTCDNMQVDLNGSASYDDDNDPLSYTWTVKSKPENSVIVDGDLDSTAYPSFTPDKLGSYIISLIVNDGKEDSVVDDVNITVGVGIIMHNGTGYCTVVSLYTDRIWLDRNLGASQVCTESRDSGSFADDAAYVASQKDCFGDYYQWGRNFDGHQDSTSGSTTTQATDVNNAGNEFITESSDWADAAYSDGSQREANWSNTDGSSVCPVGFRVPSIAELKEETLDNGVSNRDTAFTNFLKLPSAGYRYYYSGSLYSQGSWGYVWTGSVNDSGSQAVYFYSDGAGTYYYARAGGYSVRCLRETSTQQ